MPTRLPGFPSASVPLRKIVHEFSGVEVPSVPSRIVQIIVAKRLSGHAYAEGPEHDEFTHDQGNNAKSLLWLE